MKRLPGRERPQHLQNILGASEAQKVAQLLAKEFYYSLDFYKEENRALFRSPRSYDEAKYDIIIEYAKSKPDFDVKEYTDNGIIQKDRIYDSYLEEYESEIGETCLYLNPEEAALYKKLQNNLQAFATGKVTAGSRELGTDLEKFIRAVRATIEHVVYVKNKPEKDPNAMHYDMAYKVYGRWLDHLETLMGNGQASGLFVNGNPIGPKSQHQR